MDAKAAVKIGNFSRGGKSRVLTKALDHDFKPDSTLTPFGIFLPKYDDLFLYFTPFTLTSDFIVDTLELWWLKQKKFSPSVNTLVINQDNGPENQSHRTQFVKRMVEFVAKSNTSVSLAYYPPYHSKYNPIERCFGVLENHWNGSILDTLDSVLHFAHSMTWKGKHPYVELISKPYQTGVKVPKFLMKSLESKLVRFPGLERWFVDIPSLSI